MSWSSWIARIYIRKRYFFFFYILLLYEPNPRHPKIAVDFVDFVDIFRKASKHAGLLNRGRVDILWIFSWTVDSSVDAPFFAGVLDKGPLV